MKPLIVNCIFLLFMQICGLTWLKLSHSGIIKNFTKQQQSGKMAYFPLKSMKTSGKIQAKFRNKFWSWSTWKNPIRKHQQPPRPFSTYLIQFAPSKWRWRTQYGTTVYERPYPNQDKDSNYQSGTSSILHNPKWGLKGHGCSLHH